MVGNVWGWTRSLWGLRDKQKLAFKLKFAYPHQVDDGRENLEAGNEAARVLRGGSFRGDRDRARCAFRIGVSPNGWSGDWGFRVVVSPPRAAPAL